MTIQLDIWGNITDYIFNDKWYRQTFIENKLVRYKDYQGNYWDTNLGYFFLLILKLKFVTGQYHQYKTKDFIFDGKLYYITEPILINGELQVNVGEKTADDEIMALFSQQITEGIDREILRELRELATENQLPLMAELLSGGAIEENTEPKIKDIKLKNYEYNRYFVGGAEI